MPEAVPSVPLNITFVGDSTVGQLMDAWAKLLEGTGGHVHLKYRGLDLVPHVQEDVDSYLAAVVADADVVVFGFGSWYHHSPYSEEMGLGANESHSAAVVDACGGISFNPADERGYATARRQLIRKWCKPADDEAAHRSDLLRFARSIRGLQGRMGRRPPLLLWRDTPPQHFSTPSGLYPIRNKSSLAPSCTAIQNVERARVKNRIAEDVLGPLFARRADGGPPMLRFVSVYDMMVRHPEAHPVHSGNMSIVDCTHFCSPTNLMWEMLGLLGREIRSGLQESDEWARSRGTDS